jgi:hypothetical protein
MSGMPVDRRAFLGQIGLGAGLSLVPLAVFAAAPQFPALVARRVFFENPEYRNVQISPDGRHLSYLAPLGGVRNLWVAPLDAPRDAQRLTRIIDRDIGWDYRWAHTNRHLAFSRDHDGDENWRCASVDMATLATPPLSPERGVRAFVQESDHKFPTEMLLRHNQRDKQFFDMFRVDLLSGKSELVYENREYYSLITDSSFRLHLGGRVQPVGDFAGSSIRIPTGRAPVPGLPVSP